MLLFGLLILISVSNNLYGQRKKKNPERHFAAISFAEVKAYELDIWQRIANLSLIPPRININPLPKYDYDRLDYGMNMGIERTPSGRFWACWTAGGDNPDSFMILINSNDSGETWSKPKVVVDSQNPEFNEKRTVQNGNLWTDPSGSLWFFFDQSMMDFDGRAGVWSSVCKNPDAENPIWSKPARIWHGTAKSKPVVLSGGEWVLPVSLLNRDIIDKSSGKYLNAYHELDSLRMAHMFISHNKGKTWLRQGGIRFPSASFDEHHIIELNDGTLWMTARTNNGIWESFSNDKGKKWTNPQKYLEHTSSRHFIRRLKSGRILLVKHGELNEKTNNRSKLMAFISEDEGKTWKGGLILDARDNISYPDGIQAPDGRIYISYDHERSKLGEILMAKFNEEDILAGKLVSPASKLGMLMCHPLKNIGLIKNN